MQSNDTFYSEYKPTFSEYKGPVSHVIQTPVAMPTLNLSQQGIAKYSWDITVDK